MNGKTQHVTHYAITSYSETDDGRKSRQKVQTFVIDDIVSFIKQSKTNINSNKNARKNISLQKQKLIFYSNQKLKQFFQQIRSTFFQNK